MPRILFEKTGSAVWISHLDLMRLFQRAFKRAGLPLKHTQGFSPKPSVSIALPLSVGVQSRCELLDFELDTNELVSNAQIVRRLNEMLVDGVRVLDCYDDGGKLKDLAFLQCTLTLEYDSGVGSSAKEIRQLLSRESLVVQKKTKNGMQDQDIIPLIRSFDLYNDDHTVTIDAVICCQNPTLNPMQIVEAVRSYLPTCTPDFAVCCRQKLFNTALKDFK